MGNIRRMNQQEVEAWSLAIHRACSPGWVPALRAAFSHLMPFVDEDCETAYTDCRYRIGLSPKLLDPEQTPDTVLATVMLHETMHNTQHHRQRLLEKKELNGKLTNFVTDLEINSIIAEGVLGIDLSKGPIDNNGHWDYLFGEVKELTQEEADNMNQAGGYPKQYKAGDRVYIGGLLPETGQFHDLPANLTAEQYLESFEWEEEEVTLAEMMGGGQNQQNCPVCGQPMNSGNQGSSQSQDGQSGQSQGSQQGQDGDDGQDGGAGGSQQGQNVSGSDGQGDSQNQGGQGDGSQGGSQGQDGAGGSQGGTCPHCGQPTDGDQNQGNGQGQGSQQGQGGQGASGSDGWGGFIDRYGDTKGKVTHIYKKNADGTRTEVGQDAWVDRIDVDGEDDVWNQASELGIDPISRGEEQRVKEQIAHDIEEYRRSNGYGAGAGGMLLSYVERGLRPPVVDWKKMLRRVTSRACQQMSKGQDDFTYRRPNRRHSGSEYIQPSMTSYIPTIRFAIDTSGSMSAQEYHKALSEAEGILRVARAKIECVCVDYSASEVRKVRSVKEITAEMVGGGGTDMGAAVRQVCDEKKKDRPDVLVIATDGCYDWNSFAETLKAPELKHTTVIVLLVYKFDEDRYYGEQSNVDGYAELLRKYNKNAKVVQAWV